MMTWRWDLWPASDCDALEWRFMELLVDLCWKIKQNRISGIIWHGNKYVNPNFKYRAQLSCILVCRASYRVSCIPCRLWQNSHLFRVFPGWDSPSTRFYLTNQRIAYNLPIDFNNWCTCVKWGYLYHFLLYMFIGCTC